MADQSILKSAVLPASPMPLFKWSTPHFYIQVWFVLQIKKKIVWCLRAASVPSWVPNCGLAGKGWPKGGNATQFNKVCNSANSVNCTSKPRKACHFGIQPPQSIDCSPSCWYLLHAIASPCIGPRGLCAIYPFRWFFGTTAHGVSAVL